MTAESRMVITDVQPHIMLCPLPKGFWWEVRFIMRLNSCHMTLNQGRRWSVITAVGDTVVVLDVSGKTVDEITKKLIDGSYKVWQDYFRKVDSRQQDWIDTAREVEDQLRRKGSVRVKFEIDRAAVSRYNEERA